MNWPQENKIHYFLSSLFTNQYKIETVGNRWGGNFRWIGGGRGAGSTVLVPVRSEEALVGESRNLQGLLWCTNTTIYYHSRRARM